MPYQININEISKEIIANASRQLNLYSYELRSAPYTVDHQRYQDELWQRKLNITIHRTKNTMHLEFKSHKHYNWLLKYS